MKAVNDTWGTEWNCKIKTRLECSEKRKPKKYSVILEADTIKQVEMKEKIEKEYLRQTTTLLEKNYVAETLSKE